MQIITKRFGIKIHKLWQLKINNNITKKSRDDFLIQIIFLRFLLFSFRFRVGLFFLSVRRLVFFLSLLLSESLFLQLPSSFLTKFLLESLHESFKLCLNSNLNEELFIFLISCSS